MPPGMAMKASDDVVHLRLALVHVRGHDELGQLDVVDELVELARDHARDLAAGREGRASEDAHRAYVAAAVDEPLAASRDGAPRASAAAAYSGRLPLLEPQKTQTDRMVAIWPPSIAARP